MKRVRDLVVTGNSAQMADAAFVREGKAWLGFSPREAIKSGGGLFSASSGDPTFPAWLGPRLFDGVFGLLSALWHLIPFVQMGRSADVILTLAAAIS